MINDDVYFVVEHNLKHNIHHRALDPRWDTTHLVTGAADNTVRLWDIQTGTYMMTMVILVFMREVFGELCDFASASPMINFISELHTMKISQS